MSQRWYVTKDGRNRLGPYSDETLRQMALDGSLSPDDMILLEGGSRWTRAGNASGLFDPPEEVPEVPLEPATQGQGGGRSQPTGATARTIPTIPGPEHRWFVSRDGGTPCGPYSAAQLVARVACGDLRPGDMLFLVGGSHWVRADSVPWLFPPPELPPEPTALLHYACPTCGKTIESDASAAGSKVRCPHCGQKVRVPTPPTPTNHTLLGILPPASQGANDDTPSNEDDRDSARKPRADHASGDPDSPDDADQFPPCPDGSAWVGTLVLSAELCVLFFVILLGCGPHANFMLLKLFLVMMMLACVIGAAVFTWAIFAFLSQCPECHRFWAKEVVGKCVIAQSRAYGLVSRTAHHRSSGSVNVDGKYGSTSQSGTSTWHERVPVIETTIRSKYRCRYCRFQWGKDREVVVEDFSRD
jgi:DNA-directed RNA polymerase subunit RPC12/RpoP